MQLMLTDFMDKFHGLFHATSPDTDLVLSSAGLTILSFLPHEARVGPGVAN